MTTTTADTSTSSKNIFGQPLSIFGVPVDRETIFSNHRGVYQKKVEKRQRSLIVKSTFIKFFMHHGEQIRCLTTGYSPVNVVEQVMTGPSFIFFKRALFIFTDKRILHIPTRFNRSSRGAISQILYEDCAGIEFKGRSLHVKYKNGTSEAFPYIGRREKKKIQSLISDLSLSPKEAGRLRGRVYLCPSCANLLDEGKRACPSCNLGFKSTTQAVIRSLLIPGGGYFYNRYPISGTIIMIAELALIAAIALQWFSIRSETPNSIWILVLLAGVLALEKASVTYHAVERVRNFIPRTDDFIVRKV